MTSVVGAREERSWIDVTLSAW